MMTNFLSIVLYFRIEQDVTGAVDRMVTGAVLYFRIDPSGGYQHHGRGCC
jgi:hypothetical protein